jgi:molybdopterin-guanine dinucleotide biosynthesis protein B
MSIQNKHAAVPMISIVGNSGVGKTTLIEKLIPEFTRRGFSVGTIKHDIHGFQLDKPGKDSWRHKQAGASVTLISSPHQIGMVMDVDREYQPAELVKLLPDIDIVLLEGYKRASHPKIEIFRPEVYPEPVCRNDEYLIALVSNVPVDIGVLRFTSDDIKGVADFILYYFHIDD